MAATVASHDVADTRRRMSSCALRASLAGVSASADWQASMKSDAWSAIATTPAYGSTTSRIGVLTIGLPAAMYSSIFVGLMKRVDSLSANGSRQTSQPAISCGSSSYGCMPR